jgi:preprotein translocase subunit SecE
MAVQEDVKRGQRPREGQNGPSADESPEADARSEAEVRPDEEVRPDAQPRSRSEARAESAAEPQPDTGESDPGATDDHVPAPVGASPTQLGTRRFVYAAYFAGAIGIAFIFSKVIDFAWLKMQSYKPAIGDPRDDIVTPLAGIVGAGAAVYYWYRTRARELAEQVATEMSKVTWPSRAEVTNGTVVVILTTVVSTVFFALMDKFWSFITNLVYGGT